MTFTCIIYIVNDLDASFMSSFGAKFLGEAVTIGLPCQSGRNEKQIEKVRQPSQFRYIWLDVK